MHGGRGAEGRGGVRLGIAVVAWLFADAALSACPICFQVEDAGVVSGVRAAVAVLGGVTGAVLFGVAVFVRRVARAERSEEK